MSILFELPGILEQAEKKCENLLQKAEKAASHSVQQENTFFGKAPDFPSKWKERERCRGYFGICDNAEFLAQEIVRGGLKSAIDLIYIDPPFFSQTEQGTRIEIESPIYDEKVTGKLSAYSDIWRHDMGSYLEMLALRLMLMKETLKSTGSIFVHLDWHAVHAVKLIMDEIFGEKNFVNEIIWTYKSGGAARRHYSRKHDTILFYGKSERYKFYLQKEKSYNRGLKPYRFKGVEEFRDEIGWYTMVNQKDVWQIDMVGRSSGERLNYATQKPEALLSRIIDAVTDEGDLTADFFCGSGTLAAVAAKKGRRFICTDISSLAVANGLKRPLKAGCRCCLSPGSSHTQRLTVVRRGEELELLHYEAELKNLPLRFRDERQKMLLQSIVKDDSLSLIDYWGTGIMKNGIFRFSDVVFRKKGGRAETRIFPKEKHESGGEFLIFAVDIFGNIVFSQPIE